MIANNAPKATSRIHTEILLKCKEAKNNYDTELANYLISKTASIIACYIDKFPGSALSKKIDEHAAVSKSLVDITPGQPDAFTRHFPTDKEILSRYVGKKDEYSMNKQIEYFGKHYPTLQPQQQQEVRSLYINDWQNFKIAAKTHICKQFIKLACNTIKNLFSFNFAGFRQSWNKANETLSYANKNTATRIQNLPDPSVTTSKLFKTHTPAPSVQDTANKQKQRPAI